MKEEVGVEVEEMKDVGGISGIQCNLN